jgi:hypothetical protein
LPTGHTGRMLDERVSGMEVPIMMPQDFPTSGLEQAARVAAVQQLDARTAAALAALSDRIDALARELRSMSPHDSRRRLAAARHQPRHPV